MRPTLNNQGSFVNRSICGSPNGLELMLQNKDTFKQDFHKLKQMLIKTQQKKKREEAALRVQNTKTDESQLDANNCASMSSSLANKQTNAFDNNNAPRKYQKIETSKKQQLRKMQQLQAQQEAKEEEKRLKQLIKKSGAENVQIAKYAALPDEKL